MTKIYLVNLDRSVARLEHMRRQFAALGLDVERVSATDGSSIDLAPYAGSGLLPGEIGCFLSHREIWNKLVRSEEEYALVLEDDVRLSPDLPRLLAAINWVPDSAGLVKLDTSGGLIGVAKSGSRTPCRRSLHLLRTHHGGTAGYIVSRAYAAKLLAGSTTLKEAVDHFMFGHDAVANDDGQIWQLIPALVAQEKRFNPTPDQEFESLIQPNRRRRRSLPRRFFRNLGKPFSLLAGATERLYRSATGDIRFVKMTFR